MNIRQPFPEIPETTPSTDNPWLLAFRVFTANVRRSILTVVLCALIGGSLGLLVKSFLPRTYHAFAQLLFDPQGLKVFNNALKTGHFDANSAINYVEGQMLVLRSERVLSRVLRTSCPAFAQSPGSPGKPPANRTSAPYCPGSSAGGNWLKAITSLGKSLNVYRTGRSFVVTVQASGRSPQSAALLASAVVEAYRLESQATRTAATQRLTRELTARLTVLRSRLQASELAANTYAQSKDLQRVGGSWPVERQLATVTASLTEAARKVVRAESLYQALKTGPITAETLGALPGSINAQTLRQMLTRRTGIQAEIAALSARAGRRHPDRVSLAGKLAKLNRSISTQVAAIRNAARTAYRSAKAEQARLQARSKKLTQRFGKADRANIKLKALEQKVAANKRVVEAFETRVREAAEFGNIDADNLRLVSKAQVPALGRAWPRQVLAALIGMFLGVFVAISGILMVAVIRSGSARSGSAINNPGMAVREDNRRREPLDDPDIVNLRSIAQEMRRRDLPREQALHRRAS